MWKCFKVNMFGPEGGKYIEQLLDKVVEAGTITILKGHLDRYFDGKGLDRYGLNMGR